VWGVDVVPPDTRAPGGAGIRDGLSETSLKLSLFKILLLAILKLQNYNV